MKLGNTMQPPLRLGVVGLGRAFALMLPTFLDHPLVQLVAAADPREEAQRRFVEDFQAAAYRDPEQLCANPLVQAVYIASPHELHVDHVRMAIKYGKHVLVEKPMATTIADCRVMIDEAKQAGVQMLVGHSHSFDLPYQRTRHLIGSGAYGAVRMINAVNFTDFVYRPRRFDELNTKGIGGGVVFSQAAHQVDIVRLLAGSPALTVRATTASLDASRPTMGAYSAQILFQNGAFASLTYSGYGRFDTDEFNGWIGETGRAKDPTGYGRARQSLNDVETYEDEENLKNSRSFGPYGKDAFRAPPDPAYNHFGLVIVSCDKADLRPTPLGVVIYGDTERRIESLPKPFVPRGEVIDELYEAVVSGKPAMHTGEQGLATLEICLAILESGSTGREIRLDHQT
jgi:phthalate 4,5-cis-dihydrodiol dehydrogenase